MIDPGQLAEIVPNVDPVWTGHLNDAMGLYGIDTPEREAMFLAQAAWESGGFRDLVENLNYSPQGLLAEFPRCFTPAEAVDYAHDSERIANRVYANRYGNGPEESGEGFTFRGRGLFGITFLDNYRLCGKAIGVDLVSDPDLLEEPLYAALSAAWFFSMRGCCEIADTGNFPAVTRRINAALDHEADREALWRKAKSALGC